MLSNKILFKGKLKTLTVFEAQGKLKNAECNFLIGYQKGSYSFSFQGVCVHVCRVVSVAIAAAKNLARV